MFLVVWFTNIFFLKNKIYQTFLFKPYDFSNSKLSISFKSFFTFKKVCNINNKQFFLFRYIYLSNFSTISFFFFYFLKKSNVLDNLNFNNLNHLTLKNSNNYLFFSSFYNFGSNNFSSFNFKNSFNNLNFNKLQVFIKTLFETMSLNSKVFSFKIKFSVSDFFKYLNNKSIENINILFLRKNKVFNKGRYSRNRQYYRTGVYWCLYVNIIAVIGIYFWFYRFNMNFGYLWWILYIFIFSLFFSRSYSLNVFGLFSTFRQIFKSFLWYFNLINSFFFSFYNYLFKFLK